MLNTAARATFVLIFCSGVLVSQSAQDANLLDKLLVYDGYPRVAEPSPAEKVDVARKLEVLRQKAFGKERQKLSFLLAALGSRYSSHRDYLVRALDACSRRDLGSECDEDTAGFVIGLYHQGHKKVLYPLMRASLRSDGALSAALGDLLSEVLTKSSLEFLPVLGRLNDLEQATVCHAAGSSDGGGLSPETLRAVRRDLERKGGTVALRCLRQVEAGGQTASAPTFAPGVSPIHRGRPPKR